ncbi:MAG: isoaspartyl peptidase/L-asparaginase [Ignavibacteria bacterium]|nr:isoaspartyl peptidase/L-asparaginase [Ignavibacteria bacterium]MBT8383021.1 isoaspartyl peptidase/L-asparaginase [Ignavibacteria bacterium]MBT8391876.1 isoaspartyl peptidase/L-asparaginase [Ignavibacteria bacterium]NNJ52969.1 isoaspartyl peptidase/L-asparaginase [Ignavibacteriaceae bacterium]NNL21444.1 isoaspartyl peptidase/L-asparaginase [Ignavibacteriaceae bacterium]
MKILFSKTALSTLLLLIIITFLPIRIFSQELSGKYTIVLHGGAGYISPDISEKIKLAYFKSLSDALELGKIILEEGGTSLDAVEQVVRYFEDDTLFNAGRGAVFTAEGRNELDASIMNGKDLSSDAVTGVKIIKNPISLARLVMEKTPHILFAGKGADYLGLKMEVETVDPSYFKVERRYQQWKMRMKKTEKSDGETVGCVAIDQFGNIAAATSTGGLTGKWAGRVGDSPLISAGTYANNKTCGVSGTGTGELFIKHTVAFHISALMEYKDYSLQKAAEEVINSIMPVGSGGIIAVDKEGNYVFVFNTPSMVRGVATSDGIFEVKIWN